VIRLGELVMILELHRQGMSISAIARQVGLDRKTIRRYIARGLEPPAYQPRPPQPTRLAPFEPYLRERVTAFPELTGRRLLREIGERGYPGGYTAVTDFLREVRPAKVSPFERRFETPPGQQAQVDFAYFRTTFTDEPSTARIVWLFSLVLGHSRMLWGRFVAHQDLDTVLRCHVAAFEALSGVPAEILYDRMKTAVIGDAADGVIYNEKLLAFASHYGFLPKACRPYRAQTKGKVERPFRYIREDFFLARSFRNLDDLNAQFRHWLDSVANARRHATTRRVVAAHFAEEQPALRALPAGPYAAVLRLERRISRDGMVSLDGNLYSVPDSTRRRSVEVQVLTNEVRIFEDQHLVATHPVLEGHGKRLVARGHRQVRAASGDPTPAAQVQLHARAGEVVGCRPLAFYAAVGRRLAERGARR
jgi:transposase